MHSDSLALSQAIYIATRYYVMEDAMARTNYPSDKMDQFMVRLPAGMREAIKAEAEIKGLSMNQEIVRVLEKHFPSPPDYDAILDSVERIIENDPQIEDGDNRRKLWYILDNLRLTIQRLDLVKPNKKTSNLVYLESFVLKQLSEISQKNEEPFANVLDKSIMRGIATYDIPLSDVEKFADEYVKKPVSLYGAGDNEGGQ